MINDVSGVLLTFVKKLQGSSRKTASLTYALLRYYLKLRKVLI
jgi:hypothetical protein